MTDDNNPKPGVFGFTHAKRLNLKTGEITDIPTPMTLTHVPPPNERPFGSNLAEIAEFEITITGPLDKSLDKNGYSIEIIRSWSPGLRAFYWLTGLLPFDWWWCLKHPRKTTVSMMWRMKKRWRNRRKRN